MPEIDTPTKSRPGNPASRRATIIEDALQRNNPSELAIGYMRYETLRKLNTRRFAYLNKLNLEGRNFDDMVDEIAAGTFDWSWMMQEENRR